MLLAFVLERPVYYNYAIVPLLCIIAIGMFAFTRYRHLLSSQLSQAEESDSLQEKKPARRNAFFSFRVLVSRAIIKVLYFIGMLILTLGGIGRLLTAYSQEETMVGILILTLGNILWRIICEGWILFFSIHDILASIEKKLD